LADISQCYPPTHVKTQNTFWQTLENTEVAFQEKKEGKSSETGNMTNKTKQRQNTICAIY
jgi:hypothetical protein